MFETKQPTEKQLVFQTAIGRQKPQTLREEDTPCPFCDRNQLPPIMKEDGDILLVPNKYPILQNSMPLVLIETAQCDAELSLYDEERLHRVFRMAFDTWEEMMADPQYSSVIFLKNHGPLSGGSLRHPHMQLIGLSSVDYHSNVRHADYYGPVIYKDDHAELNISDHPRIGFTEFNAVLYHPAGFFTFCRLIQKTVHYLLHHHHGGRMTSYNLFFYRLDGLSYCKIMPRFVTTPLFIGYSIPQVVDNLASTVADIQNLYFHHPVGQQKEATK